MREEGDGEGEHEEIRALEAPHFRELDADGGEGRGLGRERAGGLRVEHDDRQSAGTGDAPEAPRHGGESLAGDDDGRGAVLEEEPGECEVETAPAMRGEPAQGAHLPGVEGGVRDGRSGREEDERAGIPSRRKMFKHRAFRRGAPAPPSSRSPRACGRWR